jgi:serine/threonine protein kinase
VSADFQRSLLAKFHEEAKLSYRLSQQSLDIARSVGFGELTTPSGIWAPFLVLEWLEGVSLATDLLQRRANQFSGRLLEEAIALLAPAARGLGYAHSQRVAHRDVKPANMFLATLPGSPERRTLKLLDFGIAKIVAEGTQAGSAAAQATAFTSFTPYYAAPEQLDPRLGATGPWTDVYALALVMTEVLTDRQPNNGDAMTLLRQTTDPDHRPTPRAFGVVTTDAVDAVCARALAVDPKLRYGDVGAYWEALVAAAHSPSPTLEDSASRTASVAASKLPRSTARMLVASPAASPAAKPVPRTLPMPAVGDSAHDPRAPSRTLPVPPGPGVAEPHRLAVPAATPGPSSPPARGSAIWIACIVGVVLAGLAFAVVAARMMGRL